MKITAAITGVPEVRRELQRIASLAREALARTAVQVEDYIEAEAGKHNRQGRLVSSIYKRPIAGGWEIGHDPRVAPHAVFVHWGTRPHVIRPKHKKALRWAGGGAFSFAKRVRHPGYKGDAWMVRAAGRAPHIFEQHVRALLASKGD